MTQYLIDASVLCGYLNTEDSNHDICKEFFQEYPSNKLFFPILSFFELHASQARRIKEKTFQGLPGNHRLKNTKFIDVDRKFFNNCQDKKIFEKFKKLKGADLVYACMAYIGKFTLVTCDSDFDVYQGEINLKKLG